MADHPYKRQPDYALWSRAVAQVASDQVDPVVQAKFQIGPGDRIVTAGSCFAQHIARHLSASGLNFHVVEQPHPHMDGEAASQYGYGLFSARYGNLYTSRQLLQLLQRALGTFTPREPAWERQGAFYDPFRTGVQPGGFESLRELQLDRAQHLRAALRAFSEMDVFVFTLGLTECWASRVDGAVFSTCPGVVAGEFDERVHEFMNLDVGAVVADLTAFVELLRELNPRFKMIITVAPVALAATALDQHVLTATTYSKSVLRVAASTIEDAMPERVAYFPSYEIVTGAHARGRYFADDLRNVVPDGVGHVMRLFLKHYAGIEPRAEPGEPVTRSEVSKLKELLDIDCEDALLDPGAGGTP
jgi:hypothetical protein